MSGLVWVRFGRVNRRVFCMNHRDICRLDCKRWNCHAAIVDHSAFPPEALTSSHCSSFCHLGFLLVDVVVLWVDQYKLPFEVLTTSHCHPRFVLVRIVAGLLNQFKLPLRVLINSHCHSKVLTTSHCRLIMVVPVRIAAGALDQFALPPRVFTISHCRLMAGPVSRCRYRFLLRRIAI